MKGRKRSASDSEDSLSSRLRTTRARLARILEQTREPIEEPVEGGEEEEPEIDECVTVSTSSSSGRHKQQTFKHQHQTPGVSWGPKQARSTRHCARAEFHLRLPVLQGHRRHWARFHQHPLQTLPQGQHNKPKRKQGPTAKPLDPNLTQLLFNLVDDRVQHRRSFECCLSTNLWVEVRGPKWTIRWGPPTKLSWAPVGDNQGPKNKATTMDPDQ